MWSKTLGLMMLVVLGWDKSLKSETLLFSDNFDRPDSKDVGNGWSLMAGSMGISNNQAANLLPGVHSGICRPLITTQPVTISATLREQNASEDIPCRYTTNLLVRNSGLLDTGYGLFVYRTSRWYNNSSVWLYDNKTLIRTIYSNFQFGESVRVSFTVFPDGRLIGSVSQDQEIFEFSFGLHDIRSSGNNFAYSSTGSDTRATKIIPPRLDDLVISSVPESDVGLLLVFLSSFVVLRKSPTFSFKF